MRNEAEGGKTGIRARLLQVLTASGVAAAYAPLLAQSPKAGVTVEADVAYGEHPRQRLDVYRAQYRRPTPVVIFAHGGAFVRGDKSVNEEVYANVLYYFARNGCLGI